MSAALLYGAATAIALMAMALIYSLRVIRGLRLAHIRTEAELKSLRNDITAVGRGAIGVGKRVQALQNRLQTTERRQEDMEQKDMGKVAFTHASKLAQMGAPTGELVSTCGLSQAEADLISLMQVRSKENNRSAA
ncbi:MAG: DUF2802 domain-containing protein [Pseudohongiellaceae bacterium]|nr:DUF2802 domain-containing protein [Pseudohongiellaceae bacterium]